MCAIILSQVCFNYPGGEKEILKDINLVFPKEGVTAIVGPNGCGKTTLTKVIMSILKPARGEIYVNDVPVKKMSLAEVSRKIAYVFQNPEKQLFCPTVEEELAFSLSGSGMNKADQEEKIRCILEYFHLTSYRKVFPLFLSQGEKQRLAIAAALLLEPEFILLDEPTTGLDNKRKDLLGMYLQKMSLLGKGVIFVSHDTSFVKKFGERLVSLGRDGCVRGDERI